jgi:ABC-2 type transport system ATP-binding protein
MLALSEDRRRGTAVIPLPTVSTRAESRSREGVLLDAVAIEKRFRARKVLDDVSFSVASGEVVALVGENGAGKSTLLRICAGLVRPDAGEVSVAGRIGYCPQEPGLLELLKVDEHLRLFGAAVGLTRAAAVAHGRELLSELGFPEQEEATARDLSGGSRQKLNLALALLGDPAVLLLDEPYQGFDHGSYVSFWDHVKRWRRAGRAIVVVSHLLVESVPVDRVLEMAVKR